MMSANDLCHRGGPDLFALVAKHYMENHSKSDDAVVNRVNTMLLPFMKKNDLFADAFSQDSNDLLTGY